MKGEVTAVKLILQIQKQHCLPGFAEQGYFPLCSKFTALPPPCSNRIRSGRDYSVSPAVTQKSIKVANRFQYHTAKRRLSPGAAAGETSKQQWRYNTHSCKPSNSSFYNNLMEVNRTYFAIAHSANAELLKHAFSSF